MFVTKWSKKRLVGFQRGVFIFSPTEFSGGGDDRGHGPDLLLLAIQLPMPRW